MHYFQNAALTKPEYYMDSSTDGCRIVKRRFEVNNFLKAAKRLDIFISDYESLVYENSLLAAIVFAEQAILLFMQRNESDQDAMGKVLTEFI